jgi:SLAP domain-containing protein
MSWLLENWFGSKESLEQVREDIHEHLHKELYLGVSGIEHPEQSSNRIPSKELFLTLQGPWDNLEEAEAELLQYVHDELPPVVRDEVGIIPFFTQVTQEGYLVLTYIRNATNRDILLQRLPLVLKTPEGEIVARKTFDLISFGPIGDQSSRPCEFMFRWNEFIKIPEQEVPLSLGLQKPVRKKADKARETNSGLSAQELEQYTQKAAEIAPVVTGEVDVQVLDITSADNAGLKVVVVFRNGLDKRLEFVDVPIIVRDQAGDQLARVKYTMENMKVEANSSRIWAFEIPASSLNKPQVDPSACTAFIPKPRQEKQADRTRTTESKGLIQ